MAERMLAAERALGRLDTSDPEACWLWPGATNGKGYGMARAGARVVRVHRLIYEHLVGPVPEGLQLDHTCRQRGCCNPRHMEPVTNRENGRRGIKGELTTHCPQGHPYDDANTYVTPRGHRKCRACNRARLRRRYHEGQVALHG